MVTASTETAPVPHSGDAADDAAVWIHPTDASQSTVITDKQGGILVYELLSRSAAPVSRRWKREQRRCALRVSARGGEAYLVGATNRSSQSLAFWKVNPDRTLTPVGTFRVSSAIGDVYGFTFYRSPSSGKTYAFVVDKESGTVEQYALDGSSGAVRGSLVRSFDNGGISEGLVADDVHHAFYASEERVGVWKYEAEPTGGATRTKIASVGTNGIAADVEGLAIYYRPDGTVLRLLLPERGNLSRFRGLGHLEDVARLRQSPVSPSTSTGVEGPADFTGLPRSSISARTRPTTGPAMKLSPTWSVPSWTSTVATGPRPLSSLASSTVPVALRFGFAFNSPISLDQENHLEQQIEVLSSSSPTPRR